MPNRYLPSAVSQQPTLFGADFRGDTVDAESEPFAHSSLAFGLLGFLVELSQPAARFEVIVLLFLEETE